MPSLLKLNYNDGRKSVSNQPFANDISITINGEEALVPSGLNILKLLQHLLLDPARVAVELNRAIVRKVEWESTGVEAGASLEIVTFVGGGRGWTELD